MFNKPQVWDEFRGFIKEYKVLSVAVAFIMGQAVNDMVKSFVNNIFMPLLNPLINSGGWENATFNIDGVSMAWGLFLSSVLRFVILALIIFFTVKKLLIRKKEVGNKKE